MESQAAGQRERQEKRSENIQKYRTKAGKKVALKERKNKNKGKPKKKWKDLPSPTAISGQQAEQGVKEGSRTVNLDDAFNTRKKQTIS